MEPSNSAKFAWGFSNKIDGLYAVWDRSLKFCYGDRTCDDHVGGDNTAVGIGDYISVLKIRMVNCKVRSIVVNANANGKKASHDGQ